MSTEKEYRQYVLDNIRQGRDDGLAGRTTSHEEVKNRFPVGWNEERVRRVLEYYQNQSEEEAVEEDTIGSEDLRE